MSVGMSVRLTDFRVSDVRFPTHLENDGSDAMHLDPDYSCAYITIITDSGKHLDSDYSCTYITIFTDSGKYLDSD